MTIQWVNCITDTFRVEDGNRTSDVHGRLLLQLGGDIEALLSRAREFPGDKIAVPNTTRAKGLHGRNYGKYAR